jgi:sugar lactone lactonase YvrE
MTPNDISVELVAPLQCEVGENPLWHPEAETLFFLDITKGTIYAYRPASNKSSVFAQTRVTGGFTLQRDGSLLLFQDGRIAILSRNGDLREIASDCCPGSERFNDVIADPEGRVYAGAMGLAFPTEWVLRPIFAVCISRTRFRVNSTISITIARRAISAISASSPISLLMKVCPMA